MKPSRLRKGDAPRCQVLNQWGRRCRRAAVATEDYFGEREIYHGLGANAVTWVRVSVCQIHLEDLE